MRKRKYLLLPAKSPARSGRLAVLGVGLGEPAVEIGQQRAVVVGRRAGNAIGLQAFADMLDRAGRLPVSSAAPPNTWVRSRVRKKVCGTICSMMVSEPARRTASSGQCQEKSGDASRSRPEVLDGDLPVAGDVGRERAAIGRQRAEVGRAAAGVPMLKKKRPASLAVRKRLQVQGRPIGSGGATGGGALRNFPARS